jgi:hypothetical protein
MTTRKIPTHFFPNENKGVTTHFCRRDFLGSTNFLLLTGAFIVAKNLGSQRQVDFFAQFFLLAISYPIKTLRPKVIAFQVVENLKMTSHRATKS